MIKQKQRLNRILKTSLNTFKITGIAVLILFIISICKSYESKLDFEALCFTSQCLENAYKMAESSFKLVNWYIELIYYCSASLGIIVAAYSYLNSVSSNALNNHISHFKIFHDVINYEVSKSQKLSPERIDFFKWYNFLFSESRKGSMDISDKYIMKIREIQAVINNSNKVYSSIDSSSFDYKKHQMEVINSLEELGIKASRLPRADFYEVELDIFNLIDTVNRSFTSGEKVFDLPKRQYI